MLKQALYFRNTLYEDSWWISIVKKLTIKLVWTWSLLSDRHRFCNAYVRVLTITNSPRYVSKSQDRINSWTIINVMVGLTITTSATTDTILTEKWNRLLQYTLLYLTCTAGKPINTSSLYHCPSEATCLFWLELLAFCQGVGVSLSNFWRLRWIIVSLLCTIHM